MAIVEKKVELIELFYDLIFVYAISKLTALISEPVNGTVAPDSFFIYIITSFVILQAWLYFTNYVNRVEPDVCSIQHFNACNAFNSILIVFNSGKKAQNI